MQLKLNKLQNMENKKKWILGTLTLAGTLGGTFCKSKTTKAMCFGVAGISAGILLKNTFKGEKMRVEAQCAKTEKEIEESGLDVKKVDQDDLLIPNSNELNGEDEVIFGKVLIRQAYNVFPDEMLEYDPEDILHTLHVLQNVEKNRIIISIPLPRQTKLGLGPLDMRQHFEKIFKNFVEEYTLDMQLFTNQIGLHVGKSQENGYIYFTEMERESDENFNAYLKRINTIMTAWDKGNREAHQKWDIVEEENLTLKTIRFEQHLVLEFPVFPESSQRTGLNLISTFSLLKRLTGAMTIPVTSTGREKEFEFNHIIFHPGDDYGMILQVKDGKAEEIWL